MSDAPQNEKRRRALKLLAFGGGAFLLGKILGPSINLFGGKSITLGDESRHLFKNFLVVERDNELGFYDRKGNEILVIEKE